MMYRKLFVVVSLFVSIIYSHNANAFCSGTYRNYLDFLKRMKDENVSIVSFIEKVTEDSLGSVWKVRFDEEILNPVKKKEIEILIRNNDGCYEKINVCAGETWFLILERKEYSKYWIVAGNNYPLRGISKKNTDEFLYRERMAEMFAKARKSKGAEKIMVYYPDNKIWTEGSMKKGALHGSWISYSKEGKWLSVEQYEKGMPYGLWINYYESGELLSKEVFKEGISQSYIQYYSSTGQVAMESTCSSDGYKTATRFNRDGSVEWVTATEPQAQGQESIKTYIIFAYYDNGILQKKITTLGKNKVIELYSEDGKLIETKTEDSLR